MFGFGRKKQETPVEIHPLDKARKAVDDLNAALKELPQELRHIRAWVKSGDASIRRRSEVMLGYWDTRGHKFEVIYGKDILDRQVDILNEFKP